MNQKAKNIWSIIGICLLVAVIFYVPQGVFAVMATFFLGIYYGMQGMKSDEIVNNMPDGILGTLGYVLILSSIAAVAIFVILKYINLKETFKSNKTQWKLAPALIVASIAGILVADIFSEMLNFEDMLGEQMQGMAKSIAGMIAIGLIGPIAEEITFRGVLMNKLREKGLGPWATILISAFVFGAVHANPIQIPFAMIVGVILGIIYYKTESLILCCVLHVLNNSYAVLTMNLYGDSGKDLTWADVFGGDLNTYMTLGLCLILSVSFFNWYWKKA